MSEKSKHCLLRFSWPKVACRFLSEQKGRVCHQVATLSRTLRRYIGRAGQRTRIHTSRFENPIENGAFQERVKIVDRGGAHRDVETRTHNGRTCNFQVRRIASAVAGRHPKDDDKDGTNLFDVPCPTFDASETTPAIDESNVSSLRGKTQTVGELSMDALQLRDPGRCDALSSTGGHRRSSSSKG